MKGFFDMGGYAAYVWPAYGVTLVVLLLNVAWARGALTRAIAAARRRLGTQARDT
jgi:heme exporter protein D